MDDARTALIVDVRMAGRNTVAPSEQMARRRRAQQLQDFTRIGLLPPKPSAVLGGRPPACRLVQIQDSHQKEMRVIFASATHRAQCAACL